MDAQSFSLSLIQDEGFQYVVLFDDPAIDPIRLDEPPPLGDGRGPNAVRLLGAAVGNCLSASLQSCFQRAHVDIDRMMARVEGTLFRNRDGRLRVRELRVVLEPSIAKSSEGRVDRCVDLFEEYCIVTESVRKGIDVLVEVRPRFEEGYASMVEATSPSAAEK